MTSMGFFFVRMLKHLLFFVTLLYKIVVSLYIHVNTYTYGNNTKTQHSHSVTYHLVQMADQQVRISRTRHQSIDS